MQSISSLLLSVKNLENFSRENYNSNIILKANYPNDNQRKYESHQFPIYEPRRKMLQNIRNIGAIDGKTYKISQQNTKDVDELSTTSSLSSTTTTNFTGIIILKLTAHLGTFNYVENINMFFY